MRRLLLRVVLLVASAVPLPAAGFAASAGLLAIASARAAFAQAPRFDLSAWTMVGDANISVDGDVAQADRGPGFLVTPQQFGDFEMTVDVFVAAGANSGVFIRSTDPKKPTVESGYEVNVFDTRPDQTYRTGSIVNVAKPIAKVDADGKWNTLEITARGPKLTVVVNGVTTVNEADDARFPKGHIALQFGSGVVKFRNVRIRPL
ncbi:MAG: DUF1080 domain-containing protein [Vicinamibacterales bacterium]